MFFRVTIEHRSNGAVLSFLHILPSLTAPIQFCDVAMIVFIYCIFLNIYTVYVFPCTYGTSIVQLTSILMNIFPN